MKLRIKSPEDEAKLGKLLVDTASTVREVAEHARETLGSIYSSSLSRVLEPTAIANRIFDDTIKYGGSNIPEIPIDTYFGIGEGAFDLWSTAYPGGLQYNEISGGEVFRFRPYRIDSAVAWNLDYAREARLDVVNKAMQRMLKEVLVKSQYQAFSVLAQALGSARTNGRGHVIPSFSKETNSAKKFQIEDVNRLKVLLKRLNMSWANGTTLDGGGLTDLFLSPEMMADVRRMAYNPQNTTAVPDTQESTVLGLPDGIRERIFRDPNVTSIWDINLNEMTELGVGGPYNLLFNKYYTTNGTNPAAPTWAPSTDEIIIGIDANMGAFARAVQTDGKGNTFQMEVDDQHFRRSNKAGYFGFLQESWLVGNSRAIAGILVGGT